LDEAEKAAAVLCFEDFEVDLPARDLRRRGVRVVLQDQPFEVLAALLERPGQIVSRQELRKRLWRDHVFVDFEHGLDKAVNKLRRALGDVSEHPRYIETRPRRGYRFIARVGRHPSAAPRAGSLRLLEGARAHPLAQGANVIGRDPDASVWIDSPTVSRAHARIDVAGDKAVLVDLGSKNGTALGGRPVESPTPLADGDSIELGSVRLVFRVVVPVGSTQTRPTGAASGR